MQTERQTLRQTGRFRAVLLAIGLLPSLAFAANELTREQKAHDYGCFSCHGMVHKQVGPGFAQVAERYRGDPVMPAQLAAKIRSGTVGNWGRVIMPRQTKVSEADARALAAWVLAQPAP